MVIFLGVADWDFFNFNIQARDLSIASAAIRGLSVVMWTHVLLKTPRGLSARAAARLRRSVALKIVGLLVAAGCFCAVAAWEDQWDAKGGSSPCGRRSLSEDGHSEGLVGVSDEAEGAACGTEIRPSHHRSIVAWFLAVAVEQAFFVGTTVCLSDEDLPFSFEYASDRMQVRGGVFRGRIARVGVRGAPPGGGGGRRRRLSARRRGSC